VHIIIEQSSIHGMGLLGSCASASFRHGFLPYSPLHQLYYQEYIGLTPIETAIRLLPMFFVGIALNIVFAGIVSRIPMVVLVGSVVSAFLFNLY